jgi:hypothetical protein
MGLEADVLCDEPYYSNLLGGTVGRCSSTPDTPGLTVLGVMSALS